MLIVARYDSTCPACRRAVAAGSLVEWVKGSRARHPTCAPASGPLKLSGKVCFYHPHIELDPREWSGVEIDGRCYLCSESES
jgi:hypothetical protein